MAVVGAVMSEKRNKSRTPSFLGGTITYNRDLWSADCVVKNISEEGAKLTGRNLPVLPDHFDLSIPQRKTKYRVQVRWRTKDAVGVAFEFAYPSNEYGSERPAVANKSTRVMRAAVFGDDVDMAGADTKYSL
jgi:hypothetical protein